MKNIRDGFDCGVAVVSAPDWRKVGPEFEAYLLLVDLH